ncbi:MAG TPA: right-handed parallel beta-helix repeat-containing protein [Planctomycetota bacterium]|nr:right-handed parallel beta-helix repeat-containing protein [Planctomycetota bacterium]
MRAWSLVATVAVVCASCVSAAAAENPGPRHPVGPDVPLPGPEKTHFERRVTVEGLTADAIQSACDRAAASEVKVVFLPAGEYLFEKTVDVPAGVTLLGEGSRTHCHGKDWERTVFQVSGSDVRITRLRLEGPSTTRDVRNNSTGVNVNGRESVRVDHCEIFGFCRAVNFSGGSGQLDHSSVHDCPRDGLGYGICIVAGARVLVADSEFSQCRHALASNGALDWSSPKRLGKYVHKGDVRKTHWEFVHNHVDTNDRTQYELCAVDTHPGMDGTFVIEYNVFENLRHGVGIHDGSGLIRGNLFRNLRGKPFRPFLAIYVSWGKHNDIEVEGTMPRNIEITGNRFELDGPARPYQIGKAENVTIDGKLVEETRTDPTRPTPPITRLEPVGAEYAR